MTLAETDRNLAETVDDTELRVTRVPLPQWIREPHNIYSYDRRAVTCERPEWGYAIPWMFRVLADPTGGLPMPAKPDPDDTVAKLAYWTCLAHLLAYCFGWRDLTKGLWWLQATNPRSSVPLRLLDEVWGADGAFPEFYEWSHTLSSVLTPQQPLQAREDPYMISAHLSGPLAPVTGSVSWHDNLLILDDLRGWYAALESARRDPVDVFVASVGHLGQYRLSAITGLWSRVDEATHLAGN